MRRIIFSILAVATGLAVAAWIWSHRDPMTVLPRDAGLMFASTDTSVSASGRTVRHVTIQEARLGTIGASLSLPDPLPKERLPVVLVLGGLGTGEHNIRAVGTIGANVLVGYDWPLPADFPKGVGIGDLPALRDRALAVPGQVATLLIWLREQSWADPDRVSLVGFSLGAVAAPAIEDMAQAEEIKIRATILAYGGAPLDALVVGDTRLRPAWARPVLGAAAEFLLRPVDPALHAKALQGPTLLITGTDDTIVCGPCAETLISLTPEPREVLRLPGGHVGTGPERRALLEKAMAATTDWLVARGAILRPDKTTPVP